MTNKRKYLIWAALAALLIAAVILILRPFGRDNDAPTLRDEMTSPDGDTEKQPDDDPEPPADDANGSQETDPDTTENDPGTERPEEPPEGNAPSDKNEDVPQPSPAPDTTAPSPITKPVPDENGMIELDGTWVRLPSALDSKSIKGFADKLISLKADYLSGASSVYYSVIPDKSFYASDKIYGALDHTEMTRQLSQQLSGWSCIELSDLLSLGDYYSTDMHWRQEKIVPVAQRVAKTLGFSLSASDFTTKTRSGFSGDYHRYIGNVTEDISWLESRYTSASVCDNYQRPQSTTVYDTSLLDTISPYDIYLGGSTPVVTVTNPDGPADKHLVIFRDSFGSSLAPLLLGGYGKVTLVDIRYMVSSLLPQYVNFTGADVLFLYSAVVVNNSNLLR